MQPLLKEVMGEEAVRDIIEFEKAARGFGVFFLRSSGTFQVFLVVFLGVFHVFCFLCGP